MKMLSVKPNIHQYGSTTEFFSAFHIGGGDLVFTHDFIYRPLLEPLVNGAYVLLFEHYGAGEPSSTIRQRTATARQLQVTRFAGTGIFCNAHMNSKQLKQYCQASDDVKNLLRAAISQLNLSARAYDRILKLSRTIADLGGSEDIQAAHVAEAIQYRSLDRKFWG
jgi:hypothetical protein